MQDDRARLLSALTMLEPGEERPSPDRLRTMMAADAVWHVADPVGDLPGPAAVAKGWLAPLGRALPGYRRRPDIVMGGQSRTGSGRWVAILGHVVGNFMDSLFAIEASGKLVFFRCGEFYRLADDGRIAEAFILPDLLDLARQAGQLKLPVQLGTEMLFPAPATHDGVLPSAAGRSAASVGLVEAMLTDLRSFDPATFASAGQTGPQGYWHPDMLWYGPAGIGSNFTYAGFERDHRVPFLKAFPDRVGGNHFARFGDGDYVCSGGWPSMTMTHKGDYLGIPATGRAMTLRVMDFWRVADGKIRENWVLLDMLQLFDQMGVSVLGEPTR